MRRLTLLVVFALLGFVPASAPAEEATRTEVLDLLEASLAAGEGVPAQMLVRRYLDHYPRTSRIVELQVLADYFAGDYEAASAGVAELRKDPGSPTNLGALADVIVQTYEITKGYETFKYENFEVRYSPGDDEILVPYAQFDSRSIPMPSRWRRFRPCPSRRFATPEPSRCANGAGS